MKTLKYGLTGALLGLASHAFAQNEVDALRFSQSQPSGTARTLGIGGAAAAVGGDFGSVAINPAGLGMYQTSEFTFSPGLTSLNSDSRAFGTTTSDAASNLHVANLGLVFTRRPSNNGSPWRSGSLALGLTRTASYQQSFQYAGQPDIDQDIFQRLGENQNTELDFQAAETYLTASDAQGTFIPADFFFTGPLNQGETVRTTGSNTQFDIAYGANYLDKLYIGGGIGIGLVRYDSESVLTASAVTPNDPNSAFQSLNQRTTIETRGSSFNARLGLIYRPVDAVRIGASIQTPTFFQLTEQYNSTLRAQFNQPIDIDGAGISSASSSPSFDPIDYSLTSPFRATGGLAVVIGKYGFISGDVEYLNYGAARLGNANNNGFSSGGGNFSSSNDAIQEVYGSAVNLRVGGEARLDIFRVRAGFAHYGNPFQSGFVEQRRNYFTGGLGLRQQRFFVDVAGVYEQREFVRTPYTINDPNGRTPVIEVESRPFTTTLTAGFLF